MNKKIFTFIILSLIIASQIKPGDYPFISGQMRNRFIDDGPYLRGQIGNPNSGDYHGIQILNNAGFVLRGSHMR